MTADTSPPPGWGPLFRTSPLIEHLGGFASRGRGEALQLGLRVLPHHANTRGTMHGGVIATLADTALGYLLAFRSDPPRPLVTSSLTVDYLSPGEVGEWIEARIDTTEESGRTVSAAGHLRAGDRIVARMRAVFVDRSPA